ncbi:MAG: glycosyltransferase family 39 protein, partial [Geodermatophilaceae bacterium]|nr:glycosyltransferase family 39 protein [Geodermatophilaceae bacterium]
MTTARSAGVHGSPELSAVPVRPVALIVLAQVVLLTALSGRYGYHRDELYFRIAGEQLAWGYVDQPPLTPLLAKLSTAAFGDSLVGLRVVASLLAAASVLVLVLIARELGGSRRALLLTAGCAAGSAIVFALGHMLATASADLFLWLLFSWLALRLLRTGDPRWFVPLGLVLGVGLLNKYLIGLLAFGLLVAVAIVGPRVVLRSWWFAGGALLALAVAAPNLWWQIAQGWPQWEVAAGLAAEDGAENRALFVPLQLVYLSPLFVPLWVAGAVRIWRTAELRWARSVVVAYVLLAGCVLALGGKSYYVLPLLLVLLA